jgi:PAS domain S-box-containing protein
MLGISAERRFDNQTSVSVSGASQAAELIAARDWSATGLGPANDWPVALRTLVDVMLGSNQPMFIVWGAERTLLYNDAYAEILASKHPAAVGRDFLEVWHEIRADLAPIVEQAYRGEPVHMDDIELWMERKGFREETHFSFSYTPMRGDTGEVAGFFCTCQEITGQIIAERRLRESEASARMAAERVQLALAAGAIIGTWVWDLPADRFTVDEAFAKVFGIDPALGHEGLSLEQLLAAVHPDDRAGLVAAIDDAVARGGHYVHEYRVRDAGGNYRWIEANGRVEKAEDGTSSRFPGVLLDMEERRAIKAERDQATALLRTFADAVPGVVYAKDRQGRMVVANRGTTELIGKPPELYLGKTDAEFLDDKEQAAAVMATDERIMSSGVAEQLEEQVSLPDGTRVLWLSTKVPLRDGAGEVVGLVGSSIDITARKEIEAALEDERQTLQLLNRTGAAVAAELDLERVVQLVTDAGVELTGAQFGAFFYNVLNDAGESYMLYTLSGAARSDFENFGMPRATAVFKPTFDGDDVIRSHDILADSRYGHSAPHYGMPKGHLPVRSYLAVPVASRSGEVIGGLFFGHAEPGRFTERDETVMTGIAAQAAIAIDNARLYQAAQRANETLERRVAEALAERKLLADIVESTDAFVQVVDLDFNFLGINRASADEFERIYGVRPKVGDNMLDLLAGKPEDRAAVEQVWRRALQGEQFTEIAEFGDPRRARRFYEMKYNTLRDADGKLIGAYQFVYDVTERLRDQRRLSEAEEALRQSQKMEAVGQLVSGLAHDFNNLLGAVVGSLDLIRRRADDPDRVRRFAEAGLQAAERGSKLTGQLLAFSRSQRIEVRPLIVCDVIEGVRDMLARTLGPMIELEFDLNPCPVPVLADATQVEMTILNLAINARDAMPEGGRLRIGTTPCRIEGDPELTDGDYVELSVTDTGSGMDEATLRRAMDPFFTTKPVGKGTGLGLAQVYGSARQSGGTVRIESRLGQGTTVRVLLPRTDMTVQAAAAVDEAALSRLRSRATVLVVDDDADLRSVLVNSLDTLGYRVIEAADGTSGLAALEQQRPDMMVVDFAMPGMNGAEVAKAARERWPGLPVVLTSGYADTDAIEQAVGKGAKVLRKPFRIDELLGAVSDAVNGT